MFTTALLSDNHPAHVCIANLEWLKHQSRETAPQPPKSTGKPTPVFLIKGDERLFFPSVTAAADRLYTTTSLICRARDKKITVRGWRVEAA